MVVTRKSPLAALAAVGEARAGRLQLQHHLLGGAEEMLALLGEDEAARMPVEQRARPRSRSSAPTCRLTADWLRPSESPAWVKLPASAAV